MESNKNNDGYERGLVYNAKGDLVSSFTTSLFHSEIAFSPLVVLTFKADGTISWVATAAASTAPPSTWVEGNTDPSWVGGGSYSVVSYTKTGGNALLNTSNTGSLGSDKSCSITTSVPDDTKTWTGRIRLADSKGNTVDHNATLSVEQIGGGDGFPGGGAFTTGGPDDPAVV